MKYFLPILLMMALLTAAFAPGDAPERRATLEQIAERARQGDAAALYKLAMIYDMGYDSVAVDSARSTALYRQAALLGYAPAQSFLGYRYFKGEYVAKDIDSALYWIAKAAGNGDARAANNLGYLLSEGSVVAQDYEKALHWLTIAADAGLPTGESLLADLYRRGLGTAPDTAKAVSLYTRAIEGGLQDAEMKLLSMMGRKWESLPADSMVRLGRYYYTRRAPSVGVTLFEYASRLGNADAFVLLGDAYSRAQGVAYDHDKSIACFLEAALRGNPSAQFVIAELLDIFPDALSAERPESVIEAFYDGKPVPKDIYSPSYWYEKAAAKGVNTASEAYSRLLD